MPSLPQPFHETPAIDPGRYLDSLTGSDGQWVLLDVRSEGEFAEGHLPGSINCPVLNDEERHLVGLTYKQSGQQAAIDLGTKLVWESRGHRAREWLAKAAAIGNGKQILVSCWRGGLRSLLAASWVQEALVQSGVAQKLAGSAPVSRLTGGYKATRGLLLAAIEAPREMVVLAGMTGSGKTALLHQLQSGHFDFDTRRVIDLEGLASHRGSSFGHAVLSSGQRKEQPSQQYFENNLGLQLLRGAAGSLIIEDESTMIGRIALPLEFRRQMRAAPVVVVETPIAERSRAIFNEYVTLPLQSGCDVDALWRILADNISVLERRLGGAETKVALQLLAAGRATPGEFTAQEPWIRLLLEKYYDRAYLQSGQLADRCVIFRGDVKSCRDFLLSSKGVGR